MAKQLPGHVNFTARIPEDVARDFKIALIQNGHIRDGVVTMFLRDYIKESKGKGAKRKAKA